MSNIIWKFIIYQGKEYNNFEVSTDGQIRNAKTQKVYKLHLNKTGYWQVCVSLGSKKNKKIFKVHKAVAETFIPNIENKPSVNHIDGNKQNNVVNNLEWVTNSENIQHASRSGLLHPMCGIDNVSSKLTYDDVIYIRTHYIPNDSQYGTRALGRKFNVNHETIRDVIHNNTYKNI